MSSRTATAPIPPPAVDLGKQNGRLLPAYRPIQYLGAKGRSAEIIADAVLNLAGTESAPTVFDPFTGSTVVAQVLAARGARVLAADALGFSAAMAQALLGVDRDARDDALAAGERIRLEAATHTAALLEPWSKAVTDETEAIADRDADALFTLSDRLPQIWRTKGATRDQLDQFRVASGSGRGVVLTHYAGTYFGLRQAATIDGIRIAIAAEALSPWERQAAHTALFSAMSAAVFSAGKHFAQPYRVRDGKSLTFARQRSLQDRAVDIASVFTASLLAICAHARSGSEGHDVRHARVEAWTEGSFWRDERVHVVYADPPYTAQQYSRYYHVLEVVHSYQAPQLQMRHGTVTSGLYPVDRHKSRYSSKRFALSAFVELFEACGARNSALALSYSATRADRPGNPRMVSLSDLVQQARRSFNEVEVLELSHAYRQFNNSEFASSDRADPEVIISCR